MFAGNFSVIGAPRYRFPVITIRSGADASRIPS